MPQPKVTVKSTAFNLKGKKGSISFKWKSTEPLTPENEKEFIAGIEDILSYQLENNTSC